MTDTALTRESLNSVTSHRRKAPPGARPATRPASEAPVPASSPPSCRSQPPSSRHPQPLRPQALPLPRALQSLSLLDRWGWCRRSRCAEAPGSVPVTLDCAVTLCLSSLQTQKPRPMRGVASRGHAVRSQSGNPVGAASLPPPGSLPKLPLQEWGSKPGGRRTMGSCCQARQPPSSRPRLSQGPRPRPLPRGPHLAG